MSLGEPTRVRGPREQSPGGQSCGSADDGASAAGERPLLSCGASRHAAASGPGALASARQSRDPRPVGSREYAKECAHNVVEFLVTNGYPKTMPVEKFYKEPTNKDFFEVFRFIYSKIDPQYEFEGPMENEIHTIMKRLKYPTEVNKSKMQAVNGPNTWPQLLAVLDWLRELTFLNDRFVQPLASCTSEHGPKMSWFVRQMQESYPKFLEGENQQEIDERMQQEVLERQTALKQENERLIEHCQTTEQKLQELELQAHQILEMQTQPEKLRDEKEREEHLIGQQVEKAHRLDKQLQLLEEQSKSGAETVEQLRANIRQLTEQVEGQAYSKKDIERLKCERDQLRKLSDELQIEVDQAENDVWEITMRETAKTQDIGRMVRRIEEKVGYDQELLIRVDPNEPTDFLSSLDFEEQRNNQQTRAERLAEEVKAEQAALNQLEDECRADQLQIQALEKEMEFLRDSLEQKRRISEENRVEQTEKLETLRRVVRDAEDKNYHITMEGDGPTPAEMRQMVDEARLDLAATRDRFAQELEQMKDCVRREEVEDVQVQQCMKKEIENFADDVERTYRSTMAELETITAQSPAIRPTNQARGAACK